jgi:hypothetical protein
MVNGFTEKRGAKMAEKLPPDILQTLINADRLFDEEEYSKARDLYREVAINIPSESLSNCWLSHEHEHMQFLKRLIAIHPGDFNSLMALAGHVLNGNGFSRAISICNELLGIYAGNDSKTSSIRLLRLKASLRSKIYNTSTVDDVVVNSSYKI